jgi:hypothetical protein
MDTINGILWLTAALVGTTVMCCSVVSVVDCIRLFLTARGTVEQIEARDDALIVIAILAGAFAIAALTHFIGTETIARITWLILALIALAGMCLGVLRTGYSAWLLLTARGNGEQIAEAKNILWYSVAGTAIIAGAYVLMVLVRVYL